MSLNVALLEQSFARVRPNAAAFGADFYETLFAAEPGARALFAGADMKSQQKKLMDSLVLVIENIENGDVLSNALRGLGARHVKFGVRVEHFPLVGTALLQTFAKHLGPQWTPEVKQAWVEAYGAISALMTEGMEVS